MESMPRAQCGPNDRVETDLQGRVTAIDRVNGESLQSYNCNLELVGQHAGEGAGWQLAWLDDCAYYGQASGNPYQRQPVPNPTGSPGHVNPGTVVMDVSDSANPQPVNYLTSTSMIDPWESLKVNPDRRLLGSINARNGSGGPEFDFYDLAGDCTQPKLLFSGALGTSLGHGGNFAPDGHTYYGGPNNVAGGLKAVDLSDPTNPELLLEGFPLGMHDLSVSEDGTRLYMATTAVGGFSILDVTDVQQRKATPDVTVVSTLAFEDNYLPQMTQPIYVDGRPYVVYVDEGFSSGQQKTRCLQGLPPWGSGKIVDISDEENPQIASILRLEVADPANCLMTITDSETVGFQYDGHYCTASDGRTDNTTGVVHDAVILMCAFMESGVRVFDIRDPYAPREIAYYNPPGNPSYKPGTYHSYSQVCDTTDWAGAHSRYVPERNEIWITSQCNAFQTLRLSKPLDELLAASAAAG